MIRNLKNNIVWELILLRSLLLCLFPLFSACQNIPEEGTYGNRDRKELDRNEIVIPLNSLDPEYLFIEEELLYELNH